MPNEPGCARAVLGLAGWLESIRGQGGYGGPVAHWWRDCLVDCRPGHDWRYEGIIAGYLSLHKTTGDATWLARARRAGDDLVGAQDEAGHFAQSRFELNPGTGGTPHEAAACTGLLRLALHLRDDDPSAAQRYRDAARRNLEQGQIARLWDREAQSFRDDPGQPSFVPNKACTLIEALVLLAEATGDERYVAQYALPTAEAVLRHQVRQPGGTLDGAIAQNSFTGRVVAKYFPYYVARCIPGLVELHRLTGDDRYVDAALGAGRFVARCREADGGFPQVVYGDGRVNPSPRWVAAIGDVLRALEMLRPYGFVDDPSTSHAWLLGGLLPSGGVMTARGFASQGGGSPPADLPEFRDLLPVAGWSDKAFRYVAGRVDAGALAAAREERLSQPMEAECVFLGRRMTLTADAKEIALRESRRSVYRWRSGDDWAWAEPWMVVR